MKKYAKSEDTVECRCKTLRFGKATAIKGEYNLWGDHCQCYVGGKRVKDRETQTTVTHLYAYGKRKKL
jgi:hypothetical protein